jgi:D-sedoheptulose 7-phosphate isomerase
MTSAARLSAADPSAADLVIARIGASISTLQSLLEPRVLMQIVEAAELVAWSIGNGGQVLLFGNGGSASDAEHLAAELVGRFAFDRPALPAAALTANSAIVTALGNDYGFEHLFSRQVEAMGRVDDVAIGLSTSGRSPNVVAGLDAARRLGMATVGLTGAEGVAFAAPCTVGICVDSRDTARIQESHILIGHVMCEIAELRAFDRSGRELGARS